MSLLLHVLLVMAGLSGAGLRAEGRGLSGAGLRAEGRGLQSVLAGTRAVDLAVQPSPRTVDYGLFGALHLSRPAAPAAHAVLLFSDRDGWTARQQALGDALAAQHALVVGIDLPAYLARMEAIDDACSYPAGHVEEVAHWIERHEGIGDYAAPLVVGDGAGATFAYALAAQAPAGTFEGLFTLGWDGALRVPKPLCPGDAGAMTAVTPHGDYRVTPVAQLPLAWTALPFADGARVDGVLAPFAFARRVFGEWLPAFASAAAPVQLAARYADARRRADVPRGALPDDVADLPLTEVAPAAPAKDPANAHRIAIIATGDGGWAGLDRGVADALAASGMRVVGFSTLKFFWHRQTPAAAAQAIARVIAHYAAADPQARFVLIGYSFGASLVPVILNRLPDAARVRVEAGVMVSPDDAAVFEIHVGDWFGSTAHDDALPLAPEVARGTLPLLCVHGADEDDSFCPQAKAPRLRAIALPGGHHYDGDYAALGAAIVANLPRTGAATP